MKRSRIGVSLVALTAACALTLSGCAAEKKSDSSSAAGAGIVTVNITEPKGALTPGDTQEQSGGTVIESLWEGLAYYGDNGAFTLGVAESIEPDASNRSLWTVKLRKDAVFSDGTPVQAHNFVDAWNYAADTGNALPQQGFFADIKGYDDQKSVKELSGLKIVDDYTFTIDATPDFKERLGFSAYFPLPDVAFTDMKEFGKHPIGNGPYKFANDDAWKHDTSISLVKNESYVGTRAAKNEGVNFMMYSTLDAAYADLMDNKLDVLVDIPDTNYGTFKDDLGDRAIVQASAINSTLTISESLEHFSGEEGKLRRQALSMAIDRPEIVKVIFQDIYSPMRDFTSPVISGYNDNLKGVDVLDYNPTKAKELWAEADKISPWSGSLGLAFNADGSHAAWVEAVTNQWSKNLGITAEPKSYPTFAAFLEARTTDTVGAPFRAGWMGDYPGAMTFLQPLYASTGSSNDGKYSNPEFDALLNKAANAADANEANTYFDQAQEVLLQDLPSIPLWYQGQAAGYSENVSNVKFAWNSTPLVYDIVKK